MSKFLNLGKSDFIKGGVVIVLGVVLGALQEGLQTHGLNLGEYDWLGILDVAWKAAAIYLSKNFLTAENGKVFGKI